MKILVGVCPDDSGADALALGAVLSRLTGAPLILTHIHPPPFEFPSLGSVDAEWLAFVEERANAAVEEARASLESDWGITNVETYIHAAQSRGRGLIKAAEDLDARIIVIGPAPGGQKGQVSLGSIADRLLHGSSAAVALAPEGYRETAPEALGRITVGFRDSEESQLALQTALRLAEPQGLAVALLTLVLRTTRIMGSRSGRDAERSIMEMMVARAVEQQQAFLTEVGQTGIDGVVVQGDTTDRALSRYDWRDDDLLCLASSSEGPLHRVVMGDITHKILRNSDVPAIVLPRRFELRPATPS